MSDDFFRKVLADFGFPAVFALILLWIIDRHAKIVAMAQVQLMKKLGTAVDLIQRDMVELRVTQTLIAAKILGEVKTPIGNLPKSKPADEDGD